jgi:hypothetical protein
LTFFPEQYNQPKGIQMTITRTVYDTLIMKAQLKADELDHSVAIVVWGLNADQMELVELHTTGNSGQHDMSRVNALLDAHEGSEILEFVGPSY